jgi:hypothetical protein
MLMSGREELSNVMDIEFTYESSIQDSQEDCILPMESCGRVYTDLIGWEDGWRSAPYYDYERDEPLLRAEMVVRFARNPEISSDELLGLDLAKKSGGSNASWECAVDGKRVRNFLVNCAEPANERRR